MIFKVDHIALSTETPNEAMDFLTSLGYEPSFRATNLNNPKIKRSLLACWRDIHSLALFEKRGSFPIEIVDQTAVQARGGSFLLPVCSGMDLTQFKNSGFKHEEIEISGRKFGQFHIPCFGEGAILYDLAEPASLADPGIRECVMYSTCPADSAALLKALGFSVLAHPDESFVATWRDLYSGSVFGITIAKSRLNRLPMLDDEGFNCLALLVGSLAREQKVLQSTGTEFTTSEYFEVNGRRLELAFARCPGGELIEFICLAKT